MVAAAPVLDVNEIVISVDDAMFAAIDGVAQLRWRLLEAVGAGARRVVVDLSAVSQLSSTAVAALLGVHRVCRARGGAVVLRGPTRSTLNLLYRTGLWRVMQVEGGPRQGPARSW